MRTSVPPPTSGFPNLVSGPGIVDSTGHDSHSVVVRACAWPLVSLFLTAACGAGDAGQRPPLSRAADDGMEKLTTGVSQLCAALGRCCATGGFAFNRGACEARARRRFVEPQCQQGAFFDVEAATECLDRAIELVNGCQEEQDVPVCDRICTGRKPMGAPCTTTDECAKGDAIQVQCRPVDDVDVCAPQRARRGELCTSTVSDATPGHRMTWLNSPSQRGGACHYEDGLYCDPQNRCQALVAQGGDCQSDVACGSAAWCDPEQHQCVPCSAPVGEAGRGLNACVQVGAKGDPGENRQPAGNPLATAQHCAAAPF